MMSITFLPFLTIFAFSTFNLVANNLDNTKVLQKNRPIEKISFVSSYSERGMEIRYYVFTKKPATLPTEVIVDKVKYPLYKTKAEAIESIKYSGLKQDYTIVYVVSDKKKDSEIVAITD